MQLIAEKRKALEKLIRIAGSVNSQQNALNEVALAVRPSQDFPAKITRYFKALEDRLKETDSSSLLTKLEIIEATIKQTIEKVLQLASLDVSELRDDLIETIDIDSFHQLIDEFKQRTQTSLALRFILKRRNMAIAPLKIPVSQEVIAEELENLKEKEKKCINQVRIEINSIIEDVDSLLSADIYSEELNSELNRVKSAMKVNIDFLDRGGLPAKMPNAFDIVVLQTSPENAQTFPLDVDEDNDDVVLHESTEQENSGAESNSESALEVKTKFKEDNKKKKPKNSTRSLTFFGKLRRWLLSSWKTKWKDIQ